MADDFAKLPEKWRDGGTDDQAPGSWGYDEYGRYVALRISLWRLGIRLPSPKYAFASLQDPTIVRHIETYLRILHYIAAAGHIRDAKIRTWLFTNMSRRRMDKANMAWLRENITDKDREMMLGSLIGRK